MAQTNPSRHAWLLILGIALFCVPLLLSLGWGAFFSDSAFFTLQAARSVAAEFALPASSAPALAAGTLTKSPLLIGLLAAGGSYAPQIALAGSALGWSVTAVLILFSLRAVGRPIAAAAASVLLVFSPLLIATTGSEISWALALGWAALALTVLPGALPVRPSAAVWLKLLLLMLLLGIHFDAATILFVLSLLAIDVYNGRASWLPFTILAAYALLWGILMNPRYGSPATADPVLWLRSGYALLARQQLTWLFLPFILAGLWDVWTWDTAGGDPHVENTGRGASRSTPTMPGAPTSGQMLFVLLIFWTVAGVIGRSTTAPVIAAVTAVALAGLGAAWFSRKLLASDGLAVDQQRASLLVPLLLVAPLLLVSLANLWGLYSARPVLQAELQAQAAAWIRQNSDPDVILYAPLRVGLLSERETLPAVVEEIRDQNIDDVYALLLSHVPDIVVSENSLAWDYITRTTWFQDRYEVRTRFRNDYAADSPLTVWEYAPSQFDEGDQETLRAVVNDSFALVGYRFEPQTITPGDDLYLTLYLQALQPFENGFTTVVHLSAPDDGWVWAWREEWTPRSFPGEWWRPGQVIPERIRVPTTADLPLGAYDLQVFWRDGDERERHWPIVRDGDDSVLDRVFLGYVNAPPYADRSQATPAGARFADAILLDSFEFSPAVPGEAWDVTLFWDALSSPPEDYTVFVHLMDGDGQIVAAHDGMPGENRFPTTAWKPGQIVSDERQLILPADLAAGSYQVNVGLYLLETGERLPVWDTTGVEQADRILPLATVDIGG